MRLAHPPLSAVTLIAALLAGTTALADPATLTGSVTYRERMALPPEAVLTVQLRDVSLADAAAPLLAETVIAPAGQVPIAYSLDYDDSEVQPGHRYALQARITHEDRLLFVTATHHPILDGTENATDILLERATAPAPAADGPAGSWQVDEIRGEAVLENAKPSLEIAGDGTVSGSGGCNRMMGRAEIGDTGLAFGQMAATMMACPPEIMAQEQGVFAALSETRQWQIDPTDHRLRLLDEEGTVLAILSRN